MLIDDILEYREMRTGLMALRLEVDPSIADEMLSRCEKAIQAVRALAYTEGYAQASSDRDRQRVRPLHLRAAQLGHVLA